jgi:hypothetical protein
MRARDALWEIAVRLLGGAMEDVHGLQRDTESPRHIGDRIARPAQP